MYKLCFNITVFFVINLLVAELKKECLRTVLKYAKRSFAYAEALFNISRTKFEAIIVVRFIFNTNFWLKFWVDFFDAHCILRFAWFKL